MSQYMREGTGQEIVRALGGTPPEGNPAAPQTLYITEATGRAIVRALGGTPPQSNPAAPQTMYITEATGRAILEAIEAGSGGGGIPPDMQKIGDGSAYVYLSLPKADDLSVTIYSGDYNSNNQALIDWGDGVSEIKSSGTNPTHTYQSSGFYTVKMTILSGALNLGGSGNSWLLGGGGNPNRLNQYKLIGLETGIWGIASAEFLNESNITVVYAGDCTYLSYNTLWCKACKLLKTVELPSLAGQHLNQSNFQGCSSLQPITIPAGITSISNAAFRDINVLEIHMQASTPPTLTSSTSAFNGISTKIYVPAGALSAYQAAENWSAYADCMEEES